MIRLDEHPDDYVVLSENADILPALPDQSFQLIYIDPPFNTGKAQRKISLRTRRSGNGDRRGFGGHTYESVETGRRSYDDEFEDYLSFLRPRLEQAHRLLRVDGTLYFHIDYREAHYCKILLDEIFGRECFLNEVIWAYDYGGRPKNRWPAKHDTILVYVRSPDRYYFDQDAIDRIPYMAPGLVTPEKAERGKLPTDVWWHTIVPTNGTEKTGYPSQKPEGVLRRIVQASSTPGRVDPRLLRRKWHDRSGRPPARPSFRPSRRQPRGHRRHAPPAGVDQPGLSRRPARTTADHRREGRASVNDGNAPAISGGIVREIPAASYSPRGSPPKYHRRWRA